MGEIKRIALVLNASNFEKHKNIIKAVHRALQKIGSCALYVVSSYGIYQTDSAYNRGELSIYQLLNEIEFDGCLIEGNLIGNDDMIQQFLKEMSGRKIPCVTLNYQNEDVPAVLTDYYGSVRAIMEHLVGAHGCRKVNLVLKPWEYPAILEQILNAYRDVLQENGIEMEERRILNQPISLEEGRSLFHVFEEKEILDADATVFQHDVVAIGFCMECEEQGCRVPEDMKLASLNYTMNSSVFRPDITGMAQGNDEICMEACRLLCSMMEGKKVPAVTLVRSRLCMGKSCGCGQDDFGREREENRELVINKIESGGQISLMMRYNDALEKVSTLDELGDCVQTLLESIDCHDFVCCLNRRDVQYLMGEEKQHISQEGKVFDEDMLALVQVSSKGGKRRKYSFPLRQGVPEAPAEGDIYLLYPLHHQAQVFGYLVIVNNYFPIEQLNYRICHESICSSIENLRRQMLLKKVITQLDEYHMRDNLTGLYNRFALERFEKRYTGKGGYTAVILDMDRLKYINDTFGHLAGDHAISSIASAITKYTSGDDLAIRYGGDEFLVLSHEREAVWEQRKVQINDWLKQQAAREELPYSLGVSVGCAISNKERPMGLSDLIAMADRAMYEDKMKRKANR